MPTYEYVCSQCGHEFEEFQAMSDAPVKDCPKCTGPVQRKISGGLFHIKGRELERYKETGAPMDHLGGGLGNCQPV